MEKAINFIKILFKKPKILIYLLLGKPISISSFNNLISIKNYETKFGTILDVGANVGQFAISSTIVFPKTTLYCFEPSKLNYQHLSKNLREFNNIKMYNLGLGELEGTFNFYEYSFDQISSLNQINPTNDNPHYKDSSYTISSVEIKSLDNIFSNLDLKYPILLKLDVQGFEDKVLRGAINTLKYIKYILIEIAFEQLYENQLVFNEMYKLLSELGYEIIAPVGMNYGKNEKIIEVDFLFQRRAS